MLVPRPRKQTFAFFAAAENLELITPPELNFEIASAQPIQMGKGTLIEYRLRLFGLPFTWTTLISHWDEGRCFVDEQLKGPYSKWVHTHTFEDAQGGTRVIDEVCYRLPLYPLGELALPLVRRQLSRIFAFRARRLSELLVDGAAA